MSASIESPKRKRAATLAAIFIGLGLRTASYSNGLNELGCLISIAGFISLLYLLLASTIGLHSHGEKPAQSKSH